MKHDFTTLQCWRSLFWLLFNRKKWHVMVKYINEGCSRWAAHEAARQYVAEAAEQPTTDKVTECPECGAEWIGEDGPGHIECTCGAWL